MIPCIFMRYVLKEGEKELCESFAPVQNANSLSNLLKEFPNTSFIRKMQKNKNIPKHLAQAIMCHPS